MLKYPFNELLGEEFMGPNAKIWSRNYNSRCRGEQSSDILKTLFAIQRLHEVLLRINVLTVLMLKNDDTNFQFETVSRVWHCQNPSLAASLAPKSSHQMGVGSFTAV